MTIDTGDTSRDFTDHAGAITSDTPTAQTLSESATPAVTPAKRPASTLFQTSTLGLRVVKFGA